MTGRKCCVPGCQSRYQKGVNLGLFQFPKDPLQRSLWLERVTPLVNVDSATICELHFDPTEVFRSRRIILQPKAVPRYNLNNPVQFYPDPIAVEHFPQRVPSLVPQGFPNLVPQGFANLVNQVAYQGVPDFLLQRVPNVAFQGFPNMVSQEVPNMGSQEIPTVVQQLTEFQPIER